MQKVALVLLPVAGLSQAGFGGTRPAACVVPGGNVVGIEFQGVVQEGTELDFPVADDIRVGRSAGLVLFQKVLEYPIPVLT